MNNDELIKTMETQYPEMCKEFKAIMREQYALWCKKMNDYGTSNIALGTNLEKEEDIKASLMGVWFRMMDKINRLKNMVVLGKKPIVDESVDDNFQDIVNYSIISQLIRRNKWGK